MLFQPSNRQNDQKITRGLREFWRGENGNIAYEIFLLHVY